MWAFINYLTLRDFNNIYPVAKQDYLDPFELVDENVTGVAAVNMDEDGGDKAGMLSSN